MQAGTTTELNLADFSRRHNITFTPVVFETPEQAFAAYNSGRCKIITSDISQLLAYKTTLTKPNDHAILNVVMSKEPLGPVVRQDDRQWFDIIKWVAFGLIEAEEQGVASDNIQQLSTSTRQPSATCSGAKGIWGLCLAFVMTLWCQSFARWAIMGKSSTAICAPSTSSAA